MLASIHFRQRLEQGDGEMQAQREPLKLMIVDDHPATREIIRRVVGDLMSDIRECHGGEAAVELCNEFTPDVVTMDLRMGAMDGLEATKRILGRCPNAVVIIVTQSNFFGLREVALQAGARHFVSKDDLVGLRRFLESGV